MNSALVAAEFDAAEYVRELGNACLGDQDGTLVMIRIYMDESGTHDGSPVVSVAAYAGRLRAWAPFIIEWNRAKRPINVFHSTDCEALKGEFKGWTEEQRNELVSRLLAIPAKYELYGIAMGINLRDFREAVADAPELGNLLGPPYGVMFQHVLHEIINRTEEAGLLDEHLALFHEQNDFHDVAMKAFLWVKARRKAHVGPMEIAFVEKDQFAPLQLADVLAYEANKRLRDPSKPQRRSIAALGDRISVEGFAKPNMQRLIARLRAFLDREEQRQGRQRDGEG